MIARDKIMHFFAGYSIAMIVSIWLYQYVGVGVASTIGVSSGVISGILKEVYDEYHEGGTGFNMYDLIATSIGSLFWAVTLVLGGMYVT